MGVMQSTINRAVSTGLGGINSAIKSFKGIDAQMADKAGKVKDQKLATMKQLRVRSIDRMKGGKQ